VSMRPATDIPRALTFALCLLIATAALVGSPVRAGAAVGLPGGRPNYVVSVVGGGLNAYFSRAAEYTFVAGSGSTGTVNETFWYWNMATFSGDASANKISTGYSSSGCNDCLVRTPVGFQPGAPLKTLGGQYHLDVNGRVVITWPNSQTETWTLTSHSTYQRLTLFNSSYNLLYGDGFGSAASFSQAASRNAVAGRILNEVEHSASYCLSHNCPKSNNGYLVTASAPVNFAADYTACSSSPCLSLTNVAQWRSIFVIDPANGRRVFWQHENQTVDGVIGPCFSKGGGHTWALLQAIDDNGQFIGFVGAEASLNARVDANAVISEVTLT
jgi:hypothetical protein